MTIELGALAWLHERRDRHGEWTTLGAAGFETRGAERPNVTVPNLGSAEWTDSGGPSDPEALDNKARAYANAHPDVQRLVNQSRAAAAAGDMQRSRQLWQQASSLAEQKINEYKQNDVLKSFEPTPWEKAHPEEMRRRRLAVSDDPVSLPGPTMNQADSYDSGGMNELANRYLARRVVELAGRPGSYRPPRTGSYKPTAGMRKSTAASMRKLADTMQERHPDLGAHQHIRDAAGALDKNMPQAANRHLTAAVGNMTPQSLRRHGLLADDQHDAAKQSMDAIHRHMLLVKDIEDLQAQNSALPHADEGVDDNDLTNKPTARQPGGDKALNAPSSTNIGRIDINVSKPQQDTSQAQAKQVAAATASGDLTTTVELATGDACYRCGTANAPDARHCKRCGNPMVPSQDYDRFASEDVTCPFCGRGDDSDAVFCDQCGKKMPAYAAFSNVELAFNPSQPRDPHGKWTKMPDNFYSGGRGQRLTAKQVSAQLRKMADAQDNPYPSRPPSSPKPVANGGSGRADTQMLARIKAATGGSNEDWRAAIANYDTAISSGKIRFGSSSFADRYPGQAGSEKAIASFMRSKLPAPYIMAANDYEFGHHHHDVSGEKRDKHGEWTTQDVIDAINKQVFSHSMKTIRQNERENSRSRVGQIDLKMLKKIVSRPVPKGVSRRGGPVLSFSAQTGTLAVTPHPFGKPGGPGLWHVKGMQLPPYVQNIAHALLREGRAKDESEAIAMARAATKRWMHGKNVHPEVRAASAGADADWRAKQARAHAHATVSAVVRAIELTGTAAGSAKDTRSGVTGQYVPAGSAQSGPRTTQSAQAKGGKQQGKPTAHQQHVAHVAHQQNNAAKKSALLQTARNDRAKAQQLIGQRNALVKALASASGKVTKGQAGSKTARNATTRTTATNTAAAKTTTSTTAAAAAKKASSAVSTAKRSKAPSVAQLRTQIAQLNTQINSLIQAANQAQAQAAKL